MRLPVFGGFFLIAVIVLTANVAAATFTDDMAFAQNTAETQYFGLAPYSGNTYGLSDPTMLTFSSVASPVGYALYRVNGAEKITVGIYTFSGTCVAQGEKGLVLGPGGTQAYWSRPENSVYAQSDGVWRLMLDHEMFLVFSRVETALPRDVKGYGLNIYASLDSGDPLPAAVTRSFRESDLCYEEYTAAIPAGTRYIKVETNDVTSYTLPGGGFYPKDRLARYTRLAIAAISGEALVMGEPAAVERQDTAAVQAPVYEAEAEEEDGASKPAAAKEDLPKEAEFEGAAGISTEKSSSSKFEGTITSSKPEKKAQSKAAQGEAVSEKEEKSKSSSVSESGPSARDEVVYEINREKSGGLMSSSVTAYIIVVTGALVLVLIFGRK